MSSVNCQLMYVMYFSRHLSLRFFPVVFHARYQVREFAALFHSHHSKYSCKFLRFQTGMQNADTRTRMKEIEQQNAKRATATPNNANGNIIVLSFNGFVCKFNRFPFGTVHLAVAHKVFNSIHK